MLKKISVLLLSLIIAPCFVLFAACSSDASVKQTPIYQGMVVTKADDTNALSARAVSNRVDDFDDDDDDDEDWFDFDDDDWHGWFRPGQHHGDSENKDEDIDQNDPYPSDPDIDDKISSLEVVGPAKDIYYTEKNTDVYVVIKLYNPDQFEIVSLVFNGVKYTNYMFAPGSDLENIKIKVEIKDETGIVSYTVDEIKYIDGTTIKDVLVNADKTVKIGIKDGEMVQALVTNPAAHLSSFEMNVQVSDDYNLLENSNGKLKAYLYDGYKILQQTELVIDRQKVEFKNLTPNTLYQVAIAGIFDDLSGDGVALHVLYEYAFYTGRLVSFTTPTITQTSVEWNYVWNNEVQNKTFTGLELFLDKDKVQNLAPTATKVENLYSDRIYTIKATYKNLKGENEAIYLHAMTQKKDTPTFVINEPTASKTDVQFTFTKTDVDNVATINKIRLLKGGEEVNSITANFDGTLSFNGLLSNTDYVLELEYTYNLNDGKGATTTSVTKAFKTQAKVAPTFEIGTPAASKTDVQFTFTKTDGDNIATINKIRLLKGGEEVNSITANFDGTLNFDGLLSNTDYVLELEYTYNLNDGKGSTTTSVTKAFKTQAKVAPTFVINEPTASKTDVQFTFTKTDPDQIATINKINLLKNGAEVQSITENFDGTLKFEGLLSNTEYEIELEYSYDMNEGAGTQTSSVTKAFKTQAKVAPKPALILKTRSADMLEFEYGNDDPDQLFKLESVELKGNGDIVSRNSLADLKFEGLASYKDYTLTIVYKYDLNDGSGEKTDEISLTEKTEFTLEVLSTVKINTEAVSEGNTIVLDINVNNTANAKFEKVVVNGEEYDVDPSSTQNKIVVRIVHNNQFEGGFTTLRVEKIYAKVDDMLQQIDCTLNNTVELFINGPLIVESVMLVDDGNVELNDLTQFNSNEKVYAYVTLKNPTGYIIDSINDNSGVEIIDANHVRLRYTNFRVSGSNYTYSTIPNKFTLTNIKYHNDYVPSKELNVSITTKDYYAFSSIEPVYIRTAADLKSMNQNKYYVLEDDIDLAGEDWSAPGDFYGYFDGQGFTIKNLTVAQNFDRPNLDLGLFNKAMGKIKNLNIENVRYVITCNQSDEDGHISIGALCAYTEGLTLEQVNVQSSISISMDNESHSYIGGVIAYIYPNHCEMNISNCNFDTFVSVICNKIQKPYSNTCIGGIIGEGNYNLISLRDIILKTELYIYNVEGYSSLISGIIGDNTNGSSLDAKNCKFNVAISTECTGSAYIFGIADTCNIYESQIEITLKASITNGYAYALISTGNIENCSIVIDIVNYNGYYSYTSSLKIKNSNLFIQFAQEVYWNFYYSLSANYENCYFLKENFKNNLPSDLVKLENCYDLSDGKTVAEIVEIMKDYWDHDIWDFEHLDEYGNPTLKNLPQQKNLST